MQNINLYKLTSKLYARPEVEDADIVSCMYTDDTIKNGHAQRHGRRHRRAGRISSGRTVHEGYRNKEPLIEGLHYDFEDDHDYKDGVEAIIKEAC